MNNPIVPTHYGGRDNPYEIVKIIDALGLDFQLGNTLKYIARAGKKDPSKHIEDLLKGKEYIDLEIAKIKAEEAVVAPTPIEEDVRETFDWTPPKFNSLQEEYLRLLASAKSKNTGPVESMFELLDKVGVSREAVRKYARLHNLNVLDVLDSIQLNKIQVDELVGN